MMGRLTTPTSTRIPAARPAIRRSSKACHRAMTPAYRNSSTSSEVRRASQIHQVPHIGLPHAAPLTSATRVQTAPTGARAAIARSAILICQTTPTKAATAIARYSPIDHIAAGT